MTDAESPEDRVRRHEEALQAALGDNRHDRFGHQVTTVGELLRLIQCLPLDLPITVDSVRRGLGGERAKARGAIPQLTVGIRSSAAVGATGDPEKPWGIVPAVELSSLEVSQGAFPSGLPWLWRLPPVEDFERAREHFFQGRQGEGLGFLARHLFEVAEMVYSADLDLDDGGDEEEEVHEISALLHEQVDRLEALAPQVHVANFVADALFVPPQS